MAARKYSDGQHLHQRRKEIDLVLSLMSFRKQFNLYFVSRANKLVEQDLFARNAISQPIIAFILQP
jgi:hypothetical protein